MNFVNDDNVFVNYHLETQSFVSVLEIPITPHPILVPEFPFFSDY